MWLCLRCKQRMTEPQEVSIQEGPGAVVVKLCENCKMEIRELYAEELATAPV